MRDPEAPYVICFAIPANDRSHWLVEAQYKSEFWQLPWDWKLPPWVNPKEKFMQSIAELFRSDSFSQSSLTKVFKSVIFGGPNPAEHALIFGGPNPAEHVLSWTIAFAKAQKSSC